MNFPPLTLEEKVDLVYLIRSGQARLLRLSSQETQAQVARRIGVSTPSMIAWEGGTIPSWHSSRRIYYTYLCQLRERYGEITVARSPREYSCRN
jgi:DNA-binding XRE family transcriptional regulator